MGQLGRQDQLSFRASKVLTQSKLTSLSGNDKNSYKSHAYSKTNNTEDCSIVEKAHPHHSHSKDQGVSTFFKVEEEERFHGNSLGTKRAHGEIRSPRNNIANSPSGNEETQNDGFGKGFVTARTKLVSILLNATVLLHLVFFFPFLFILFFSCQQHPHRGIIIFSSVFIQCPFFKA